MDIDSLAVISLHLAKKFRPVIGCGWRPRQEIQMPFFLNRHSTRPAIRQSREFSEKQNLEPIGAKRRDIDVRPFFSGPWHEIDD